MTLMNLYNIFLDSHTVKFAGLFCGYAFNFHQGMLQRKQANEIHYSKDMEDVVHFLPELLF